MCPSFAMLGLGLLLTTGLCGCAETQRVAYSVEGVHRVNNSKLAHTRLMIGPLEDYRKRTPGNEVLFNSSNAATIGKEEYCVNAEERYKEGSVGTQISEMLAAHLRKRGAVLAVSAGARANDAFYLTGTLRRYYGAQKSTSASTTTWVLFGAIGAGVAAATAPDWTPGMVAIEIVDLTLYDESGRTVADLPDIEYQKKGDLRTGADCTVVYENVNRHLRQAFEDYAPLIESAIAKAVRDTQPLASDVAQLPRATRAKQGEPPPAEPW